MTFLVTAALAVGLLVLAPIVAHLLRRGRARIQDFPPAGLVPPKRSIARERSRLEDYLPLALRGLLVLCLALLGATPFVRCSRVSLSRQRGASVALAIVIDDSQSMRLRNERGVRWELALKAAHELFDSVREGDAVSIVLAGKPARIALSATMDLRAARHVLDELTASDRPTDLAAAVQLARSSLSGLAQRDRRVALFSDLAGEPPANGELPLWTPAPELALRADDCAVTSAEKHGARVEVNVACSSPAAARGRTLTISGQVAKATLVARAGTQTLELALDPKQKAEDVALDGADALALDDRAPIASASSSLGILVVEDTADSRVATGGPPPLDQALAALDADAALRSVALLPDQADDFAGLALALLDDPGGLTPEARSALTTFVERGGVAVAFLGPRAEHAPLGASFEPFAHGALRFRGDATSDAAPQSFAWLGPEGQSFSGLSPRGHVSLLAADLLGARTLATFSDGDPFLTERALGKGLIFTLALPTDPAQSDLVFRPGFVALLDHFLDEARQRRGAGKSVAGSEWTFDAASKVTIRGPRGPVDVSERALVNGSPRKFAVVDSAGRYALHIDDASEERVVTLDPEETLAEPHALVAGSAQAQIGAPRSETNVSPEFGMVALGLLGLELGLRAWRLARTRRITSVQEPRSRAS
ncbi:MAG TPA: VWA domain-containing protein [Polyangiaceae bacterium]